MTAPVAYALLAYFVGSIPTSYLVGRIFGGVDLRREGSGNLGATNTYRVLGMKAAVPVAVVDVTKGWLPTWLFPSIDGSGVWTWTLAYGGAAIAGHIFSLWVRFKGGKGVATSAGVFIALAPGATLVALVVWTVVVAAWKIVSLASIAAAVSLPIAVMLLPQRTDPQLLAFTVGLALFVVWAHRANIGRLLRGEEKRIRDARRDRITGDETDPADAPSGEVAP